MENYNLLKKYKKNSRNNSLSIEKCKENSEINALSIEQCKKNSRNNTLSIDKYGGNIMTNSKSKSMGNSGSKSKSKSIENSNSKSKSIEKSSSKSKSIHHYDSEIFLNVVSFDKDKKEEIKGRYIKKNGKILENILEKYKNGKKQDEELFICNK